MTLSLLSAPGARPAAGAVLAAEPAAHLVFELSGQIFAVDVASVREILDLQPVATLPNAPADLVGMIDVRGQGVAVIDLAGRLGLAGGGRDEARILVFEFGARATPIAAVADRVLAVAEIAPGEIEPAPRATGGWDAAALRGVTRMDGRIVMILELPALLGAGARGPFDFE